MRRQSSLPDETQALLGDGSKLHYYYEDADKHKIVDFDPNGDSDNPIEWTKSYRWCIVLLLAFMAFTVYVLHTTQSGTR